MVQAMHAGRIAAPSRPWYKVLYIQVLVAIVLGVAVGYFAPDTGKALKPLGDAFIALIKMMIAPVIFCTVVHGIASMRDLKKLGRVGVKTVLYFEIVSTVALILGLIVINTVQPGVGFNADLAKLDTSKTSGYVEQAHSLSTTDFLLNIIPGSFFSAFAKGDLLQVLFIAVLSAFAISAMGERGLDVPLHVLLTV